MSYDYQYGGQPAVPNSSTAIISLIAGILGLTFLPIIGSIVALITGYMAKKEIEQSHGAIGGSGLVTAGIVLGWIGIGLTVVGICVFGAIFLVPLCLIPLGISLQEYGSLWGILLTLS